MSPGREMSDPRVGSPVIGARFHPSKERRWFFRKKDGWTVHTTGWTWKDDVLLEKEELTSAILNEVAKGRPPYDTNRPHGNFAWVAIGPGRASFGVDAIRSVPLLYSVRGSLLRISDEVRLLEPQGLHQGSVVEYAAGGVVTGQSTLFKEIGAVEAGSIVQVEGSEVRPRRRYRYSPRYPDHIDERQAIKKLDQAVLTAHRKALTGLKDVQLVVPISGGLDSRLVAATLSRLGCKHVVCFTYGRKNNWEMKAGRKVAESLGFEWIPIEYDHSIWERLVRDERFWEFCRFAENGVSVPHPNDYAAVRWLDENGHLDRSSVFMPGHTGDFLCGSHLKYVLDPQWNADPSDLAGAILRKHFSLWGRLWENEGLRSALEVSVRSGLSPFDPVDPESIASAYEEWEWQERQAKFIVNSVRTYEWFGHDWRLPLWDLGLMEFWSQVPLDMKVNKYLYKAYLHQVDPGGVFSEVSTPDPWHAEGGSSVRKSQVRTSRGIEHLRRVRKLFHDWRTDDLGMARAHGFVGYVLRNTDKRHFISLMSREVLARLHAVDLDKVGLEETTGSDRPA